MYYPYWIFFIRFNTLTEIFKQLVFWYLILKSFSSQLSLWLLKFSISKISSVVKNSIVWKPVGFMMFPLKRYFSPQRCKRESATFVFYIKIYPLKRESLTRFWTCFSGNLLWLGCSAQELPWKQFFNLLDNFSVTFLQSKHYLVGPRGSVNRDRRSHVDTGYT